MKTKIFVFLFFIGLTLNNNLIAQRATYPYSTGFEGWSSFPDGSGYWEESSDYYGGVDIQNYDPFSGENCIKIYAYCCNDYGPNTSISAAVLKLDLSNMSSAYLNFASKTIYSVTRKYGDPTICNSLPQAGNHTESGVFFSANGGATYVKVHSFDIANNTWQNYTLNILELAQQNGLSLNNQFVIKFQFYAVSDQDYQFTNCIFNVNLLLDDISITGCKSVWSFNNTNNLHQSPMTDGIYSASNYIETGTNVVIQSNTSVSLTAGNYISLHPGFTAQANSSLSAKIEEDPCNLTYGLARSESNLKSIKEPQEGDNTLKTTLKIFPNPSNGIIDIVCSENLVQSEIILTDMAGKRIYSNKVLDTSFKLDLSNLSKGFYLIRFNGHKDNISQIVILK